MAVSAPRQVYLLPLDNGGSPNVPGGYICLPPPTSPPYILRFVIDGSSPICREGTLWVNIPEEGVPLGRTNFRGFRLEPSFKQDIHIDIPITCVGAFAFYCAFSPLPAFSVSSVPAPKPTKSPIHYINVSPRVTLQGECLPINSLSIFSVVSKFMGEYPKSWHKHLHGISQRKYNMVHFTPLMRRGASDSPYSIYDQMTFDPDPFPRGEEDVAELVAKMEEEYGLLAITDVVWNHTASNSEWLKRHPEAGYSVETAPWLESALVLDGALLAFGGELGSLGLPTDLKSVDDLVLVVNAMRDRVIGGIRLWEFYAVNVEADSESILNEWKAGTAASVENHELDGIKDWTLSHKASFIREKAIPTAGQILGRFSRTVDSRIGAAVLTALFGSYQDFSSDIGSVEKELVEILDEVNMPFYKEYDADVATIMEQVFNRVKYIRLDEHGPKLGPITTESPLVDPYFTRLPVDEITRKHSPKALALVNNGWIWNADALKDNAGPGSKAYLRREVIVWGDCVKLRYGSSPDDSPFLWKYMTRYTRLMAKHFSGFRIDNCHSTPIVVAEHLLDEARAVRPNLTVFAELFTGSEDIDYVFVKRLGLSALIREAMQAWDAEELSRLVHRHGGRPIGSFDIDLPSAVNSHAIASADTGGSEESISHIRPSPAQALFMDCTHDNEVPAQKRDARDTLPNAALVSMCASATGSVMGYDEIYPRSANVVTESRIYSSMSSEVTKLPVGAGDGGIGGVKKLLNELHTTVGVDGYEEAYVRHDSGFLTVHRVHPKTRKGVFLIAHTAFSGHSDGRLMSPTCLAGTRVKHIGSWVLDVDSSESAISEALADKEYLRGLPSHVREFEGTRTEVHEDDTIISVLDSFVPGAVALFETWIPAAEHSAGLDKHITDGVDEAFSELDLIDLNLVLYRCEAEERDSSYTQDGVFNIPNHGPLVYAGLQGWWSVLEEVVEYNKLDHPLCDNIRHGQWALDYIVARMEKVAKREDYVSLYKPTAWLREKFEVVRALPSFLLPSYFAIIVQVAYQAACRRSFQLMGPSVRQGPEFARQLAMVSVQQTGYMNSASLWPTKRVPSLAAGLPHFAAEWARCWGRDVFISLRGLYLCTGRFDDAREHIIAFASVLKHGMIPNLLSSGTVPRYNSRDSVWYLLQCIQDYCKMAPGGVQLLSEMVPRRFLPYDDTWFSFDDSRAYSTSSTVSEIVQEVLQRHALGLSFREHNAGTDLDMQMKPEGFQIDVNVDWDTGFVFGGNQFNCGTWQDKMGESEKAGNKGVPGTPRDGAAVEITGLVYSALRWVAELHDGGLHQHDGVYLDDAHSKSITFKDWAARIKYNFERCYYIPVSSGEDAHHDVDPSIVNRRGIYKDLYRSGKPYEDYQFRANFTIAMTVSPDLFTPSRALSALSTADSVLLGPIGVATLDPTDLNYQPNYNNSDDSSNFATAKGRNYHQGPEWVWLRGYFLRALLHFDLRRKHTPAERTETFQQVSQRLEGCKYALRSSPWRGLAELTNENGAFCADSSPTQSWSAGCLLDVYHDVCSLQGEGFGGS